MDSLYTLIEQTGFFFLDWRMLVMWVVVGILLYLAVYKQFEPLLLVPIAFGALLANLPTQGISNQPPGEIRAPVDGVVTQVFTQEGAHVKMPHVEKEMPLHPQIQDLYGSQLHKAMQGETTDRYGKDTLLFAVKDPSAEKSEGDTVNEAVFMVWAKSSGRVTKVLVEPGDEVIAGQVIAEVHSDHAGGLFYYISLGVILEIFPPLIFLGVGALTDFGPLIANPRMLLLGAAAQFGVFATYLGAVLLGFDTGQAGAIGIIGGADGPTSIFLANALAPELLAPIAVAAYSYMALVPVIQPPIMRALTSESERKIRMKSLRKVSRTEKLVFAMIVVVFCILLVPAASPLIGMLMLGNFLRECKVTERLNKAAQNELINITTIFLGVSVGITMTGDRFIRFETLSILLLGIIAFGIATGAGVGMAKLMNVFSKNKINPLIGSAGVSAVPMAARVSQVEGQKADSGNFLLMHAMGPNVAGVIGTALVAGYFLTVLGGGH